LDFENSGMALRQISDIQLANLSFRPDEVATVALSSSHVLLAGITNSASPEITVLLWDMRYSVLLASQSMSIPTTMPYTPKQGGARLELVLATASHVALVLSPVSSTTIMKPSKEVKSSVYLIPFSVPSSSTIALAMGRAPATQAWTTTSSTTKPKIDKQQASVVTAMRTAMEQNRPQAADTAFFDWVEEHPLAEVSKAFRYAWIVSLTKL
jgi:hypothetical protein